MNSPFYDAKTYIVRKSVGYQLRRARNLITTRLEATFARHPASKDITFVQWTVLMCLRDALAATPSEICQHLYYDSGAFTRLMDQMEEKGWITRARSCGDRRVVELKLTDAGRELVESLVIVAVKCYNEVLEPFSHEEANQLVGLLARFNDRITQLGDA
jgi:DNA-binding MarR family transcriptional regulator